jgi:hydrogenase maturation factor HypF (carbamoyltransferase family)
MQRDVARRQIHIRGIVQGVGFRPIVYNLAQGLGLCGYVLNSSAGVTIEVEGQCAELDSFVSRLGQETHLWRKSRISPSRCLRVPGTAIS